MITSDVQAEILTLHFTDKWSARAIARKVGLHRRSVQRVIARRSVQLQRGPAVRTSLLDTFKASIVEHLRGNPHVTSTALLNKLREVGYVGGISTLRAYVRT